MNFRASFIMGALATCLFLSAGQPQDNSGNGGGFGGGGPVSGPGGGDGPGLSVPGRLNGTTPGQGPLPAPVNDTATPDGSQGPGRPGGQGGEGPQQGGGGVNSQGTSGPNNGTAPPRTNGTAGAEDQPGGQKQSGQAPRGDDPRPRVWGQPNALNETEFDDRKTPRRIGFLGRSANVRIYPNYSDPSVYLQLRFSGLTELDAAGRPVPQHSVPSLADADSAAFAAGNTTFDGINMSYVHITLDPRTRPGFNGPLCRPPTGNDSNSDGTGSEGEGASRPPSNRRALLQGGSSASPPLPPPPPPPQVNVSLLFGLDDAAVFPYGPDEVTVPRNGLKWTVGFADWPFCNNSNALSVTLDILLPGNSTTARISQSASGDSTTLSLSLGDTYNASLAFLNYALDGPDGTIKMPVNVTLSDNGGDVVSVNMVLPNPRSYNATAVWYDPTTTTTSAYLSADDPGNGYIESSTLSTGGSDGNGAQVLRAGLGTAVVATLLGMLLLAL